MKIPTLPKWAAFLLGAALTAAEAVQLQLGFSQRTEAVLTMAIVIIAAVVPAVSPSQFRAEVPAQILNLLAGLVGALLVLEQSVAMSSVAHTIIAAVVVAAVALGINATQAAVVTAARDVRG